MPLRKKLHNTVLEACFRPNTARSSASRGVFLPGHPLPMFVCRSHAGAGGTKEAV